MESQYIAFEGARRIATGPLSEVALKAKRVIERGERGPVLLFEAETSARIDVDLRGSDEEVLSRLEPPRPGPGRPRLGVVPREVTLLPRHWEWLNQQPGGASAALRRLVDQARRVTVESERVRKGREAAYRFLVAMAGDRQGFEEATRALFAGDRARFNRLIDRWPADIKTHARTLMDRTQDA